ncbi:MAG: Hsp33 family molecular chaperone [Rhizobiaceae bacterium]|nr:Hsp33 family molecular chaperone [Rhizobiaceae bacterium]
MSEQHLEPEEFSFAGDDVVVPFAVEPLDVRGRTIQMGAMLDTILKRHDYPQDVSFLVAELVVLSVILGSSLKFDGNFILQTQSDGPVSLAVVDFSTPDSVRAYARFDKDALAKATEEGKASPRELLGNGVMALTIDQGQHMQRYQGIVALDGASLEEVAHQYFQQSEQIPTKVKMSVAQIIRRLEDGSVETAWRAGGLITQFLPEAGERIVTRDLPSGRDDEDMDDREDDEAWTEAAALVSTIGDDELTDPNISVERLLYRLFHEHGVRVFEGIPVRENCTCSREKVIALVKRFEDDPEKPANADEGYETKCEFCSTIYKITANELA